MNNTHTNIMGLNTGVFLSSNRGISPIDPPYQRPKLHFLRYALFILALAVGASAASAKDNPSVEFDDRYSDFSDNWSGAYLGVSLGGGWGESQATYNRNGNDHLTKESVEPSGYLGSLTLGYNFRLGNNIVVGVEGDLGIMDLDGQKTGFWDDHI